MRTRLFVATALAVALAAGTTWADDKNTKDAEVEKALSKIAQLGPHVEVTNKDAKGRITSCVVVGQSRISTVLGKAKGLETARQRARNACSVEFLRWLKEKPVVLHGQRDETITLLEGSEDNSKDDALKESGKAVEKSSTKFASISAGLVRGLQVLHVEVSDKDKTYTLVMGWSAENAKATERIENGDKEPKDGESNKPDESSTTSKEVKKVLDKKIESKKVTSDDARKFLPK
jgi:hypothetical protein